MLSRSDIEAAYQPFVGATPGMRQAITAVTHGTINKLVLKVEGFLTAGVEGTFSYYLPLD